MVIGVQKESFSRTISDEVNSDRTAKRLRCQGFSHLFILTNPGNAKQGLENQAQFLMRFIKFALNFEAEKPSPDTISDEDNTIFDEVRTISDEDNTILDEDNTIFDEIGRLYFIYKK